MGDNLIRFMFLCHAAMQLGQHLPEGVPDILHTHDWQTALLPLLSSTTIQPGPTRKRSTRSTTWPIKAFSHPIGCLY